MPALTAKRSHKKKKKKAKPSPGPDVHKQYSHNTAAAARDGERTVSCDAGGGRGGGGGGGSGGGDGGGGASGGGDGGHSGATTESDDVAANGAAYGRGLHWSTLRLNVSVCCGQGDGACRGWLGDV